MTMVQASEAQASEVQEAGTRARFFSPQSGHRLSVIVQGGVSKGNIVQTANHCQHWRDLFPQAEIILAISSLDIIDNTSPDGNPAGLTLDMPNRDGSLSATALEVIKSVCDKVVQAHGGLPLPPIKTDSPGPNNVNLQIVAAQAGLAVATGTHILRTRSDLIFADDSFIEQWLQGQHVPRGASSALEQRVLISYLYTLNPYTYERMPFHYSDWFHFGLADDVRALWNVPLATMADAAYYKTHDCAEHSNYDERRVLTRYAVEQFINFHSFKAFFSDLRLDFHNDLRDIARSIDILCDNFVPCDLIAARCIFDKYAMDFENPAKALHCITPQDWALLARALPDERQAMLLDRQDMAQDPSRLPFPRYYPASALHTKVGERVHGTIMAVTRPGVLLHGPYATLPRGHYTASIDLRQFKGKGIVDARVTLEEGKTLLAEQQIGLYPGLKAIEIDFDLDQDVGNQLEVVITIPGLPFIVLGGMTIRRRQDSLPAPALSVRLSAASHPMESRVGLPEDGTLRSSATRGFLLYGPYISLPAGTYALRLHTQAGGFAGSARLEVAGGPQHRRISARAVTQDDLDQGVIAMNFSLARETSHVEFRLTVDDLTSMALTSIDLDKI